MFDNLFNQSAKELLSQDIKNNCLPSSILLSGPEYSGKLTCALELARVLSCKGNSKVQKGAWNCDCSSCKKNKELTSTNLVLSGSKDCLLEILACKNVFLKAAYNNSNYLLASRFLFLRAVRKLTLRFSPVLWEGDDKESKISPFLEEINENLEILSPDNPLPENEKIEEIIQKILSACSKLQTSFLYDSLPVEQIRRASFWAHLKSTDEKKILIFENCEKMNESSRNALLKILEEPPLNTNFILTTKYKSSVMPTILSRVRNYTFIERDEKCQSDVIEQIFHTDAFDFDGSIKNYLLSFLPVSLKQIDNLAQEFYEGVKEGHLISIDGIVKQANSFEPSTLFKLFLQSLAKMQNQFCSPEMSFENLNAIKDCFNAVSIYNLKPLAALEKLFRDFSSIKRKYWG